MNNRIPSLVLTGALGLGGVATGLVLVPAVASAATDGTTAAGEVSDRLSRITDALSGLVTDGTITQAQADRVASTLDEALPRGGGHGGHGGPVLDTAAEALGMTEDELRTELEAGRSLADVAGEKGVSEQDLVAALVEAAKAHLAEEVAEGDLTQEQADARLARVQTRIEALVEREGLPARGGHHGPRGGGTGQTPSEGASPGAG